MIRLENISKSYGGGKVKAVDDLSMTVESGKVFGFLGPNGAGKTTTIKIMTGILNADAGSVWLDDVNLEKEPLKAKRLFGFVPDAFEMFDRLTGMEYLNFLADVYGVGQAERKDAYRSDAAAVRAGKRDQPADPQLFSWYETKASGDRLADPPAAHLDSGRTHDRA